MSLITAYNFYLNSRARNFGSPNNFTFTLKNTISKNGVIPSEFRCKIPTVQIPFSFHQFNDFNKRTYFKLIRGVTTYDNQYFDIANGNYNANTFSTEWSRALRLKLVQLLGYNPTINIIYVPDTNHYLFEIVDDGTYSRFTFYNVEGSKQVNLSLGFASQWEITNSAGDYAESTQAVNVSPSRCLYIQSDTLVQHNSYDAYALDRAEVRTSNVLEVIPLTVQPNNYITHQNPNPTISFLANELIDAININIGDESLDVDLPDMELNWSLHIVIEEWSIDQRLVQQIEAVPTEEEIRAQLERERLIEERVKAVQDMEKLKNKIISSSNSK